jgi:hypothetical protein
VAFRSGPAIDVVSAIKLCWFLYLLILLGLRSPQVYAHPWLTLLLLFLGRAMVEDEQQAGLDGSYPIRLRSDGQIAIGSSCTNGLL